ncbi:MAG: hypothetical protein RIF32_03500 [Leptospirales bacterium]|jgi:hypothetical protein
MAQFFGDIAFMLELFAVAAGLVALHFAGRQSASGLLKAAGWLLVVGGILTAVCTSFFYFRYYAQGGFDTVHPPMSMPMDGMGKMQGSGGEMMMQGMQSKGESKHNEHHSDEQ